MNRRRHGVHASKYRVIEPPPPGAHWVGYRRYSDRDRNVSQKHTFEMQAHEMERFAAAHGWVFGGWYDEPATSGAAEDISERPALAQLLDDAAAGKLTVVLAHMSDRWARDTEIAVGSLKRLRRAGVYWATADGQWDINKPVSDGHSIAWVVDAEVNASYARKQSAKMIVARRERALAGYHNARLPWGYRRAPQPAPPPDAPSTWRPPRQPAQTHPVNFERLQQIGEWSASGLSDRQIALRAESLGWELSHPLTGVVPWTTRFIADVMRNPFPCEFAPGSGYGTIITAAGERVEGKHAAAWSWDLWQRMHASREARRLAHGYPAKTWRGLPRIFSGIAICAACGRPLHHMGRRTYSYGDGHLTSHFSVYLCQSSDNLTPCPVRAIRRGWRSIRSDAIETQFGAILSVPLPTDWRVRIVAELRRQRDEPDVAIIEERRRAIETERQHVLFQHRYGRISDQDMLDQTTRLDEALAMLPSPQVAQAQESDALAAGAAYGQHQDYWSAATGEQRMEMVRLMLQPRGMVVDLMERVITRIHPHPALLSIFQLAHPGWAVDDDGWLVVGSDSAPTDRTQTTASVS